MATKDQDLLKKATDINQLSAKEKVRLAKEAKYRKEFNMMANAAAENAKT